MKVIDILYKSIETKNEATKVVLCYSLISCIFFRDIKTKNTTLITPSTVLYHHLLVMSENFYNYFYLMFSNLYTA